MEEVGHRGVYLGLGLSLTPCCIRLPQLPVQGAPTPMTSCTTRLPKLLWTEPSEMESRDECLFPKGISVLYHRGK